MKIFACAVLTALWAAASLAQPPCVGVITAGGGQSYWQQVEQGARQAATELDIRLYARGPADEINVQAQEALIEWIVELGCRGLVLAPNSTDHLPTIERLRAQGIPTVFVDRDIGGARVSVIQTDNDRAGQMAGERMIAALGGRGTVAVFRMDPSVRTTTQREDAFIRTVRAAGLDVVVDEYLGTRVGAVREKAYQLLSAYPRVDGVFTPNESTSLGTLAALNQRTSAHEPVHIGFDASPMLTNAMEAGQLYGLVVQSPYQMGYQGVHTVHRAMNRQTVAPYYPVPASFLTRADLKNLPPQPETHSGDEPNPMSD